MADESVQCTSKCVCASIYKAVVPLSHELNLKTEEKINMQSQILRVTGFQRQFQQK